MRANEPTLTEKARWRQNKGYSHRYLDYLKHSSYDESYKRFCIKYYRNYLRGLMPQE